MKNEVKSKPLTGPYLMWGTNVSPFGLLQCSQCSLRNTWLKLSRLQDLICGKVIDMKSTDYVIAGKLHTSTSELVTK